MSEEENQDPQTAVRSRLAALRSARLAAEDEHAKREADAKLLRDLKNEEAIADAVAKYGPVGVGIGYVLTRLGVVIVKKPNHMLVRKFRDQPTNTKSWEELIEKVLVHPTEQEWQKILEDQNAVLAPVGGVVLALAGATDELSAKS